MTSGNLTEACDRRNVVHHIEDQIVVQRHVDGVGHRQRQQRIAVGRRVDDDLGADIAGAAGPIVDDELLTEMLRQRRRREAAWRHRARCRGDKGTTMRTGRDG